MRSYINLLLMLIHVTGKTTVVAIIPSAAVYYLSRERYYIISTLVVVFFASWMLVDAISVACEKEKPFKALLILLFSGFILILMHAVEYDSWGIVDSATSQPVKEFSDLTYFSLVTWTTLGYGDFRPAEGARIPAALEAVIGYVYSGMLIGIVAGTMVNTGKQALRELEP